MSLHRERLTSRMLALALLVCLCLAVFRLFVAPVLSAYSEVAGRIEDSQMLLWRYRALAAKIPELSARLQTMKEEAAHSIVYLDGSNRTLATADLQNHARGIVETAGGELQSSQVLPIDPSRKNDSVQYVSLRLQVSIGMGHLQDLLYHFETGEPSVVINEIKINQARASEGADRGATDPMLQITVEVCAFIASDSTRPSGASTTRIEMSPSTKRTDEQSLALPGDDVGSEPGTD